VSIPKKGQQAAAIYKTTQAAAIYKTLQDAATYRTVQDAAINKTVQDAAVYKTVQDAALCVAKRPGHQYLITSCVSKLLTASIMMSALRSGMSVPMMMAWQQSAISNQ
jgi:hypothetical protein